ncbi:sporulation integral membrane protein YlbJ [Lederbergia wuyishanensis]|uniref:Sporulation integral membrane protein YlbJ n=1 Tax=Lederbergia wuyishanensis TaxID=1347903 RepID=A0ABU0CZF2_9BACI|nr:sporulation integral membrane protein YlbJ [Lederbergia wuyishanensis]MCJ8006157.1 sporulation integral membrane protein YlbJ [Lederbergia wuyishanensis]MDQ0341526.1 sporulation integral membrane protein YlbJ [Lederbergia wuyishanensis]
MNFSKIKTILLASGVTIMACSMILFPEESFEASLRGLNMWWKIVFPSLFPFFVISELLIGFGVVKFMGVLLEPFMRPLFRVPGVGGFAWAMGMATGFPAGAKLSARLRQEKQLSKSEAERLVSFTNSSSPLFIFGAVSVGFFLNPRLGILLAIAHYLGNFLVGICMRFYGEKENVRYKQYRSPWRIISQALSALHQTRLKNKKPIGKLLGDAVVSSVQTLLMIGGFIILFSVLNKLLYQLNITLVLASLTEFVLSAFHLPKELGVPIIAGVFEITLGSQMASKVNEATLMQQAIITSFILGFSGFSVQAQVASILAETDIKFKPFFLARILHGFLAAVITFLLWKPFSEKFHIVSGNNAIPVMLQEHDLWWENTLKIFVLVGPLITILSLILYIYLFYKKVDSANM